VGRVLAPVLAVGVLHLGRHGTKEVLERVLVRVLVRLEVDLNPAEVLVLAVELRGLLRELPELRGREVVEVGVEVAEVAGVVVVVVLDHVPPVQAGVEKSDDLFDALGAGVDVGGLFVIDVVVRREVAGVLGGGPACLGVRLGGHLGPELYIATIGVNRRDLGVRDGRVGVESFNVLGPVGRVARGHHITRGSCAMQRAVRVGRMAVVPEGLGGR